MAPFSIVDDGKHPGTFGFAAPSYSGSTTTTITVTRTNGVNNTSPILIDYSTAAGPGTASGVDYLNTSGTLTFNDGEIVKAFPLQIIALIVRGLAFEYLGLTALGAYLTLYASHASRRAESYGRSHVASSPLSHPA